MSNFLSVTEFINAFKIYYSFKCMSIFKLPKHKGNLELDLYIRYKIRPLKIMVCSCSNNYKISFNLSLTVMIHKIYNF